MSDTGTQLMTEADVKKARTQKSAIEFNQRMLDTVKYTIWSVIGIIYVFFIGAIFIQGDWKFGLASMFFIGAAWPLRELWHKNARHKSEMIASKDYDADDPIIQSSMRIQKWLAIGLMIATFSCSIAFVALAYFGINSMFWGIASLVGMIATEGLDWVSRSTNKKLGILRVQRAEIIDRINEDHQLKKDLNKTPETASVSTHGSETFSDGQGIKLQ